MRALAICLAAAVTVLSCNAHPGGPAASGAGGSSAASGSGTGGRNGAGGVGGSAGTGGTTSAGSGGQVTAPGTGGTSTGGAGGAMDAAAAPSTADAAAPDQAPATSPGAGAGGVGGGAPGAEALLVVGQVPGIGSDIQIRMALEAKGLKVTEVLDSKSTTKDADGKALVVISYSIDSEEVIGKFQDVPAALISMEHNLLEPLGMTGKGHGWVKPATQITITAADSPLAAGLPAGDVTVFSRSGSVFWGEPSPAATKIATVKGKPNQVALFTYEKGAMMINKPAPGRRLQFFLGAHLVPEMFLNDTGLKLLEASIAWCVRP